MLELFLRFIAAPAIKIQNEEFSLADVAHGGIAEPGEGVLNRLSLGIEHGAFWHYPDVCFHAVSITLPFDRIMLHAVPRPGERRVRNPSRRFASARLPEVPCALRSNTLPEGWCETWPDHRWRAQWVSRGARVWGADDLRFLHPRDGVAGRGRPFSYCSPGIFLAVAFALPANSLTPDRGSRLFRGRCVLHPAILWLREFSLARRPRPRASSGANPFARRGRRRGGIPLSERSARRRRCRRPRWPSNRSALRIRRLPSLRPRQIAERHQNPS